MPRGCVRREAESFFLNHTVSAPPADRLQREMNALLAICNVRQHAKAAEQKFTFRDLGGGDSMTSV